LNYFFVYVYNVRVYFYCFTLPTKKVNNVATKRIDEISHRNGAILFETMGKIAGEKNLNI